MNRSAQKIEHHIVGPKVSTKLNMDQTGSTAEQTVCFCVGVNSHSAKCIGSHVIFVSETKSKGEG